jgi:hypothetical protein
MPWPLQSECNTFYGNPRNQKDPSQPSPKWESENLVRVKPPFVIYYEGKQVKAGMLVHKKVADSLARVLGVIWDKAGKSQAKIDAWGVSNFAGAYTFKLMKSGKALSMHSWGCALDLDPERNGYKDDTPNFANIPEVVAAFENEGWVWGGRWTDPCDGMHFQAARLK